MSSSSAYSIRYPLSLYEVTECCSGVLRHVLFFDRARSNTPDSPTTETVLTRPCYFAAAVSVTARARDTPPTRRSRPAL